MLAVHSHVFLLAKFHRIGIKYCFLNLKSLSFVSIKYLEDSFGIFQFS